MRTPRVPKEEADQEIKRYLFVHGSHTGVDLLLDQISISRQTAFKWYGSVQGMIVAGLQAAQRDLVERLREFHRELVAHPKLVTGQTRGSGGKGKTAVFTASTAAEMFGEYRRLLNDPKVCGGIVLRAAAEYPDPESDIHQFAANCVTEHVEILRRSLEQEKVAQPEIRARMLIAAATGLFTLPHASPREELRFLPLLFQAITQAEIAAITYGEVVASSRPSPRSRASGIERCDDEQPFIP